MVEIPLSVKEISRTEYIVDESAYRQDLFRRGVFDPAYVRLLHEAYVRAERNTAWYGHVFAEYRALVRVDRPQQISEKPRTIADYCNVHAEREHVRRILSHQQDRYGDAYETLDDELGIVDDNLRTLADEMVRGGSSPYGYARVYHPVLRETKFVSFNAVHDRHLSWQNLWSRPDVRISFLRALDWVPPHLAMRDWANLVSINELFEFTEETAEQQVSLLVSPSPEESGFGYGTISLAYAYQREEVSPEVTLLHARTLITEYSRAHLARVAREVAHEVTKPTSLRRLHAEAPSDIDFLQTVLTTHFQAIELRTVVAMLEQRMDAYDDLHVQFPEHRARQEHLVATRLENEELTDRFHQLLAPLREKYRRALSDFRSEDVLKNILVEYQKEAQRICLLLKHEELKREADAKGRSLSRVEVSQLHDAMTTAMTQRSENGSCPTVARAGKGGEKAFGEKAVLDENGECEICCRGFVEDVLTGEVHACGWKGILREGQRIDACPQCGWYPGKVQKIGVPRMVKQSVQVVEMPVFEPVRSPQSYRDDDFRERTTIQIASIPEPVAPTLVTDDGVGYWEVGLLMIKRDLYSRRVAA